MDDSPKVEEAPTTVKKNWFSRMALWQKIVAVAVVVIVVLILVINTATSAPVKVSNDFLNNIQAARADAAYSMMTPAAQATISRSDFKSVIEKIAPILNTNESMKSKEVNGETGNAAKAKVVYEIKGTDGITYTFTTNLTKDNGQWKVLNFDSAKK